MAEALGLASSIITIIELSAKAVRQCKQIIDTARDAPRDLRNILVEVSSLKAALENLDYLTQIDHGFAEEISNQKGVENAVHECEETLDDLIKQLGDLSIRNSQKTQPGKRARIGAAIAWTWNETTARKLINDVLQHKTTITLGILSQTSREVHEVKLAVHDIQETVNGQYPTMKLYPTMSVRAMRNFYRTRIVSYFVKKASTLLQSDTKRREICGWVQTTNPTNIHNTALRNHETETGEWVLRLPQWNHWLRGETSHRFLWIYGIPGAGKTVLASHLSEQCQSYCNESIGKPSFCVFYYCSYRHHQDETYPMFRWLISQLIRKTRRIPNDLLRYYEHDHPPNFMTMREALAELLVHVHTVYLLVDAVDESKPRAELLLFLENLVTDPKFCRIQLLATSRKYHDITSVLTRISYPISMSNEEVDKDIRKFIAARLEVKLLGWRAKYKSNILDVLTSKAQGMFRLAFCHVEIISRKRTELDMLSSLDSLPRTIEETYELILLEIDEQDWPLARTIFLWVCGNDMLPGSQPIPVDTLLCVLSRNGLDPAISMSENGLECLQEICTCMLTIRSGRILSSSAREISTEDVNIAKYAHYTVVEYLFSEQIKRSKVAYFALSKNEITTKFTETIFSVAETVCIDSLSPEFWSSFESYCARSALLATFTWETVLAENTALWISLVKVWSNTPSYFRRVSLLFRPPLERFPQENISMSLILRPDHDGQNSQAFASGILACLILNSSLILARKLVSYFGPQILDIPIEFDNAEFICWTEHRPSFERSGSAIEAAAITTISFSGLEAVQDGIEFLSSWFDNTKLALICVGLHVRPIEGCDCYRPENTDGCRFIKMLLQYVKSDSVVQYCLTPLQLSVHCLDLRAVKALLESGVDPNGLGSRDGNPTPIYLYQVDDRWWSASPLHTIRHADFAAEEIDVFMDIMESREAERSEIETLLIRFGAQDFGHPTDSNFVPEGFTGSVNSIIDNQSLLD